MGCLNVQRISRKVTSIAFHTYLFSDFLYKANIEGAVYKKNNRFYANALSAPNWFNNKIRCTKRISQKAKRFVFECTGVKCCECLLITLLIKIIIHFFLQIELKIIFEFFSDGFQRPSSSSCGFLQFAKRTPVKVGQNQFLWSYTFFGGSRVKL